MSRLSDMNLTEDFKGISNVGEWIYGGFVSRWFNQYFMRLTFWGRIRNSSMMESELCIDMKEEHCAAKIIYTPWWINMAIEIHHFQ